LNRRTCERRQREAEQENGRVPGADEVTAHEKTTSTRALAALAREVEALRRAVRKLGGLSMQVDDLGRVVGELAEQVSGQAAGYAAARVTAPSWLDIPNDVAALTELLEDLTSWLSDVYMRYPDAVRSLPECWLWHPEVVEELLWLMYAWHAAYRDERASVQAAGDWHDRYRPGVVRRVQELTRHCSLENHQPGNGHAMSSRPVVPLAEAIAPIADWWAVRRDAEPPVPTAEQLLETTTRDRQMRGGRR
jgi:hypothetical protein